MHILHTGNCSKYKPTTTVQYKSSEHGTNSNQFSCRKKSIKILKQVTSCALQHKAVRPADRAIQLLTALVKSYNNIQMYFHFPLSSETCQFSVLPVIFQWNQPARYFGHAAAASTSRNAWICKIWQSVIKTSNKSKIMLKHYWFTVIKMIKMNVERLPMENKKTKPSRYCMYLSN